MRASRIMKLVAAVSSSISRPVAPASSASTMAAACDVLPEASSVSKKPVSRPSGSAPMNGVRHAPRTARPSSARTLTSVSAETQRSRPSPGR